MLKTITVQVDEKDYARLLDAAAAPYNLGYPLVGVKGVVVDGQVRSVRQYGERETSPVLVYAIKSSKGFLVDDGADGPQATWSPELGDDCVQFDLRADAEDVIRTHFNRAEQTALGIHAEQLELAEEV